MKIQGFRRFIPLILAAVLVLTACGLTEAIDDSEDQVTTSFEEDTVFTVADRRVSLAEWYLYAVPAAAEKESLFSRDIWDFKTGKDKTFADSMKEEIKDEITYVKIVSSKAEELGISLSEDEVIDINLLVTDYLDGLTTQQINEYGFTPEVIKQVYSDNLLAMKVYEKLTLNIDTSIPDDEVRHMVLQYVLLSKHPDNDDSEQTEYTAAELKSMREEMERLCLEIKNKPEIEMLSQITDERYPVAELTADYSTLVERFPENIPEIAFAMNDGEIAGVYETNEAYFILDCVKREDKESTDKARIAVIEERQRKLFEKSYADWSEDAVIKLNYNIWNGLNVVPQE